MIRADKHLLTGTTSCSSEVARAPTLQALSKHGGMKLKKTGTNSMFTTARTRLKTQRTAATVSLDAHSTSSRANWIELPSAYQTHTIKMKSLDELELEKQIE